MPERDIESLGVMGWGLDAAGRFFRRRHRRRRRPPNFVCLQGKNSYYVFSKIRMSLFGRKKAPAGALSPSTVLLRGILSVYKTKQLYCVLKK